VIPVLGLVVGVVLGLVFDPTVPLWLQPYLPIAVVAALDAGFGGVRARLDRIFDAKVFVISFVSNVVVAALIVYLGDQLGVGAQLSTAVVVVLGIRIFGNAAAIRRRGRRRPLPPRPAGAATRWPRSSSACSPCCSDSPSPSR
jgi:small basic protein